jgi:hypothetical protein
MSKRFFRACKKALGDRVMDEMLQSQIEVATALNVPGTQSKKSDWVPSDMFHGYEREDMRPRSMNPVGLPIDEESWQWSRRAAARHRGKRRRTNFSLRRGAPINTR